MNAFLLFLPLNYIWRWLVVFVGDKEKPKALHAPSVRLDRCEKPPSTARPDDEIASSAFGAALWATFIEGHLQ